MRIRTWLAMAVGAVVGAGGVYLLDPEHGRARRREASIRVRRRAVADLRGLGGRATGTLRTVAREARAGFAGERPAGPGRRGTEGPSDRA